jgi:bifunctional non-homologous end joining protein LigD
LGVLASLPFIEPCRPKPVKRVPTGEQWSHEPKLDGWRCEAVRRGKQVALYSRLGRILTPRFPHIAEAVGRLPCRSVTLDGELVLADESGVNFYRLRGARSTDDVTYWVFDILELNGKDLRGLPLIDRRPHLHKLLGRTETVIYPVPSFGNGQELLISAADLGFEGVVSKLKSAPYRSGHRPEWTKIKALG